MNNNQSINSWEKVPVILNASQVALILGISESTVKRLAVKVSCRHLRQEKKFGDLRKGRSKIILSEIVNNF